MLRGSDLTTKANSKPKSRANAKSNRDPIRAPTHKITQLLHN
jgi:hypothetical protein